MSLAGQSALLFRRSVKEAWRNPTVAFILPTLVPFVTITLTSQIFRDVAMLPGFPTDNYVSWEAPGAILLAAMMGAGHSATALVIDAQTGYLSRLRLLAVRPTALLLGRLAFDVARVLPAGALVLLGSIALGAELRNGWAGAVAILGLVALWALAYGGLFFAVALRTRNAQASFALLPLFVPLMFLSTVFVPTSMMPTWIRHISSWNPFTYLIEGSRVFMTGQFSWAPVIKAVAVAFAVLTVTWCFAGRSFRALVQDD